MTSLHGYIRKRRQHNKGKLQSVFVILFFILFIALLSVQSLVVPLRLSNKVADKFLIPRLVKKYAFRLLFLVNSQIAKCIHGTKLNALEHSFGLFRDNLFFL